MAEEKIDQDELQFIVNYLGDKHKTCARLIGEARDLYKLFQQPVNSNSSNSNSSNNSNAEFVAKEARRIQKEFGLPEKNAIQMAKNALKEQKQATAIPATKASTSTLDPAYLTIEGVDGKLKQLAIAKHIGSEDENTPRVGSLSDVLKESCRGATGEKARVCKWNRMESSGDNNDCLIHSFLTATCPTFRRYPKKHKNTIARTFRTKVFPLLPEVQKHSEKAAILELVASEEFLTDREVGILAKTYTNILTFEPKIGSNPEKAVLHENPAKPKGAVYLISNRGNLHFESVKTDKGGYFIERAEADSIVEMFTSEKFQEAKRQCPFEEGDSVLYKSAPYQVLEFSWDFSGPVGKCTQAKLMSPAKYERFIREIKPVNQGASATQKQYGVVGPVPITELKAYNPFNAFSGAGGAKQKRQTRRKRRLRRL